MRRRCLQASFQARDLIGVAELHPEFAAGDVLPELVVNPDRPGRVEQRVRKRRT